MRFSRRDPDRTQALTGFRAANARIRAKHQNGTATTFDEARTDFEDAWNVFLSKGTEDDFQAWRDQRDWTARKYALWDAGKRLEPPSYAPGKPCSRFMKCPCGEIFGMHGSEEVRL